MRHEDGVRAGGHVDGIVIMFSEQHAQHANVDVGEVADTFAHHWARVARKALTRLDHLDVECLFRCDVLADELLNATGEIRILENRELHLEDRCLLVAGTRFDTRPDLAQALLRSLDGIAEALELRGNFVIAVMTKRDIRNLPTQELHRSHGDSWRGSDTDQLSLHLVLSGSGLTELA